jgi:hypothetical protein
MLFDKHLHNLLDIGGDDCESVAAHRRSMKTIPQGMKGSDSIAIGSQSSAAKPGIHSMRGTYRLS